MEVLYLYNSGILISHKNESILIDGIFSDNNEFDKMSPLYKQSLLNKKGLFENITAILFTHCHADHYDNEFVELYKTKNECALILTPEKVNGETIRSSRGTFRLGEYEISLIETGHIGSEFDACRHYAYKICAGTKIVIITGDMDPSALSNMLHIYGTEVDALFINPALLFYEMKNYENTPLKSVSNIFVYHIPTLENDKLGYRVMMNNFKKKIVQNLGDITILNENMQPVIF